MRRLVRALLAVSLVAAACGDDTQPIFTTSGTTAATGTTATGSFGRYPAEVVEEYVAGCTTEADEGLCRCTIDEFQTRLALSDFLELVDTDLESDPLVQDVIEICVRPDGTTATPPPDGTTTTVSEFVPITGLDEIVDLTVTDLEAWWANELPAVFAVDYEQVSEIGPYFPSQGDIPLCGGPLKREEFEANAFYCSINDSVQWDAEELMAPLFQEFGDFTVALVLAHEWGHAAQFRFGFDDISQPTIVSELQADCFAGAWTGRIAGEESELLRLEPGDLEEAMAGFLLIGDELGIDPLELDAHGGSFDRLNAFFDGFNEGTSKCATYEETPPDVVFIPLQPEDDPTRGGDLPYVDTAPLLAAALEVFWDEAFPELFGDPWVPVAATVPYLPSTGVLPSCGGALLADDFYVDNAFYCAADDYVAWDDEGLFPDLYLEIGDFAIGLVLANEWGRAAQARAGLPIDTPAAQLQVDCLTGVWTAAMIPVPNPMGIYLAAGDLEEGIAGFLSLSSTPGGEEMAISAFDRFAAFKNGFFDGAVVCGL